MLVDRNHRFLSQRVFPKMALIQVSLRGDDLLIEAPGCEPISVPECLESGDEREVRVWDDAVPAFVAGRTVNEWFSAFLERECRLVYMAEKHRREVSRAPGGGLVSFADGGPLLLISEASLEDLNGRLPEPVSMDRFRPNLVVSGDTPFLEDSWKRIRIGEVEFEVAWRCSRCVLTTVDPQTGVRHPEREPLRTLRSYRMSEDGVLFGQNLLPAKLGRLCVGDEVEVLA